MPTYFLLLTLTPEGRAASIDDPQRLLRIEQETERPGVECLGLYGVLGRYDFVSVVEATDNEAIARFSFEYGVRAGAHVETLPAVPISRLEPREPAGAGDGEASRALPLPGAAPIGGGPIGGGAAGGGLAGRGGAPPV